jgi:hypothetical protein
MDSPKDTSEARAADRVEWGDYTIDLVVGPPSALAELLAFGTNRTVDEMKSSSASHGAMFVVVARTRDFSEKYHSYMIGRAVAVCVAIHHPYDGWQVRQSVAAPGHDDCGLQRRLILALLRFLRDKKQAVEFQVVTTDLDRGVLV